MNNKKLNIPKYIIDCPIVSDWVYYKGELFYGKLNIEKSLDLKRAMIDLSYCATASLNEIVLKTVQYNKQKFELKKEIRWKQKS